MKATNIKKDVTKPLVTIETETDITFLGVVIYTVKRTFIANEEYPKGYWNWVELPNKNMVRDRLSFQLDEWLKFDN